MATQVSLNSGAVASAGTLAIQTNGTTQAVSISTGQVATLAQNPILTSGTINGVAYLNGSNALTTGSALVFDGTNLGIGTSSPSDTVGYGRALDIQSTTGAAIYLRDSDNPTTQYGFIAFDGNASVNNLNIINASSTGPIRLFTNGVERARLNSTGAFVLAGGTTTADGIGITFPATQSASSNANTLDDYEEGTFTPTFTSLGTVTLAYGKYTKIGRIVCFYVSFSCTSTPTANSSSFTLPFLPSTFSLGTWTQSTTAGGFIEPQTGSAIAYFATSAASSTGQFYAAVVYET